MAQFMENRFSILLFGIVLLSLINIAEFYMADAEIPEDDLYAHREYDAGIDGFILDIFTIEVPNAPAPVTMLLSIVNTALIVISGMIVASYIYDGIKALPLT